MLTILQLLNLKPSAQSIDYVENKTQFHLFNLLTEQRHAKTWNLSFTIQSDTGAGLRMLLAVDQDISAMLANMAQDPRLLEQATSAVVEAIYSGHHLYFYGCGATGRLAKQMESSFWRPFWKKVKQLPCWKKLEAHLPPDIEERVTGEMTGADRALVSSLEGFEDLQLIGRLQLQDHGIRRGDVVFCVTEGGETSSVIGTILAALDQYGDLNGDKVAEARRHLYFVYNNPDQVLRPFARSASVIDNPAITKINLTTGPQSITGSTRMQATTSETFVLGVVLEEAIARILRRHLSSTECAELGFGGLDGITARLASFDSAKKAVDSALPQLAKFTDL
jgi:N-acetylmuramic acid 6-phosphate (MurNAc-6-P) etherase